MELYKSRDFGSLFQDTFGFLKQNGKHLFKNFLIINGIFIIILMILGYFFFKFYSEIVFSGNSSAIDNYINDNIGLFIILFFLFFVVGLFAGIISYSFTPLYLKLYSERGGKNFNSQDIINSYKKNFGKIIVFLACGILLSIPLLLILGVGIFVLIITIIGILLLPMLIGGLMLFYQSTLMEYLQNKRGIWDSFGYAWKLIRSKFWAAVGCVALFYFMSYIIQNIVSMIPYFFGMIDIFTAIEEGNSMDTNEIAESMKVMMIAIFFLSFIMSTFLNVITQLNQGIVFYSLKEDNENIHTKSIIDQIGTGE